MVWGHGLGTRPGDKAVGNVWEQDLGQGLWVRSGGEAWG